MPAFVYARVSTNRSLAPPVAPRGEGDLPKARLRRHYGGSLADCPSSARNPVFERNVNEWLGDLSTIDMKKSQTARADQPSPPKTQSPGWQSP
jgi:hypothetical protein